MTARIKRKRAVRIYELLVFRCMYSNLKPIKALSDFPHNAISNYLLCLAIAPYCFAICECDANNSFHIKGNCAEQFFSCLPQCRRLNLRDNGSKFFLCYLFRNFPELCPVFFGFAAVSVLRSSPAQISVIRCLLSYITAWVLSHCISSYCGGWVLVLDRYANQNSPTARPHIFTNCIPGGFRFFRLPPITSKA